MPLAGSEATTEARSYDGMHRFLRRVRGSAVGKPCVAPDCTRLADGWGLVGHPTHLGVESHGRPVRWSVRLRDYAPLCARHNSQRDSGGSWAMCPQGHARAAWGTDARGTCRGCKREHERRLRASKRAARAAAQAGADDPAEGPVSPG